MVSEAAVIDALRVVRDPDLQRDLVALKFVKDLTIDGGRVSFSVERAMPSGASRDLIRDCVRAAVAVAMTRDDDDLPGPPGDGLGLHEAAGPGGDHRRARGRGDDGSR